MWNHVPQYNFLTTQREIGGTYYAFTCPGEIPGSLPYSFVIAFIRLTSNSFLDQAPPSPSFEAISAYIRLSHKYQMTQLYRRAMDHLKRHYTDNLHDWLEHGLHAPADDWALTHAIGVVNLARLTNETTLLPTALWMCCRLGPELLAGFAYSDGARETLSADDLALCWAARPRLVQATLSTFLRIFPAPSPESCERGPDADEGCRRFAQGFVNKLRNKPGVFTLPDPFIGYISMDGPSGKRLCEGCREAVRTTSLRLYYEVWKELPALVGVEVPGGGEDQW